MSTIPDHRAYPVSMLPEPVASATRAIRDAIGCDASMPALAILTTCAGCIGNSLTARVKPGWSELSVLWGAIITRSGGWKTPTIRAVTRPLHHLQGEAIERHKATKADYESALSVYDDDLADWKKRRRSNPSEPRPTPPIEPVAERIIIDDATTEAIAFMLSRHPRGLLMVTDELSGWLRSFDAYRNGKGADAARWLSMHTAQPITVDRKKADPIHVHRAAVSIIGGIQPQVFADAIRGQHTENGLAARLLLTMPDPSPKRWNDTGIPQHVDDSLRHLYAGLLAIPMADDNGIMRPRLVDMDQRAKALFVKFYESHAEDTEAADDALAAAFTKLEAYAVRFALIFHAVKVVTAGHDPAASMIDSETMNAAIQLVKWHRDETERVYASFHETEEQRRVRVLVHYIATKRRDPGQITPRELHRARRGTYTDSIAAAVELKNLADAGWGVLSHTTPGKEGGRPSEVFTLYEKHWCQNLQANPPSWADSGGFGAFGVLSPDRGEENEGVVVEEEDIKSPTSTTSSQNYQNLSAAGTAEGVTP